MTAQTFTSTRPNGRATSRMTSSVISVGTFAVRFGQETQIIASGLSFERQLIKKRSRSARRVEKTWTISVAGERRALMLTPAGIGAMRLG